MNKDQVTTITGADLTSEYVVIHHKDRVSLCLRAMVRQNPEDMEQVILSFRVRAQLDEDAVQDILHIGFWIDKAYPLGFNTYRGTYSSLTMGTAIKVHDYERSWNIGMNRDLLLGLHKLGIVPDPIALGAVLDKQEEELHICIGKWQTPDGSEGLSPLSNIISFPPK